MDSKSFWNREYKRPTHFSLSEEPAEDLLKFTRWLERGFGRKFLNPTVLVVDLGCGNGRNLKFLSQNYGCRGLGFDISSEAVRQAREAAGDLPLKFEARPISEPLPVENAKATIVLDMMTSHSLREKERGELKKEILRILKPGGWLFFKSNLREGDIHAERLLLRHPADEEGAYIHPKIGVYEYVWTEEKLREFFEPAFEIHVLRKSHKHILKGRPFKRRTVAAYLEKK